MSIEEAVLEKLRALPPQRQQEVLNFVESLGNKSQQGAALLRMLSASEDAVVSEDYIGELRHMRLAGEKRT